MFDGFKPFSIQRNGITLHGRTALGAPWEGPPLLLLHGHPQTHAMWHRVAPELAKRFKLVLMDLRGYGDSSRPDSDAQHIAYSKREMANDAVAVMQHFGFSTFNILAHDRGAISSSIMRCTFSG